MRFFSKIAFASLLICSFNLHAGHDYELPPEVASDGDNNFKLYANISLDITRISGVEDVGFGPTFGGDVVWHFSPGIGTFFGLDFAQLNGEENNQKVSIEYIDLPFGIAFGNPAYANATHIINLGLYYGFPLGKLKAGDSKIEAENMLGLNFEGHSDFRVNEDFFLGFHIQVKYGFRDIISDAKNPWGSSSKPLSTALGISARFW